MVHMRRIAQADPVEIAKTGAATRRAGARRNCAPSSNSGAQYAAVSGLKNQIGGSGIVVGLPLAPA
eukprot:4872091-Lingulodinium_polyedra.AAC.1